MIALGVPNTMPVLWLFALGWASARADTMWQRLVVMTAVLATVPGFFGDLPRELLVITGLTLLLRVPYLRCPQAVSTLAGVLASSSLYIYLTHWAIYPYLNSYHPLLAVIGSLVAGVLYWKICTTLMCVKTWSSLARRASS